MTTARWLAAILLTALMVSLGESPAPAGEAVANQADLEAIRHLIAETTAAFSSHDAKAFVRHYTPDAWLVTVRGESMAGTAEIESGLASIFESRAQSAKLKTLDISVRFIRPDIALAHVLNELS